MTLLSRSWQCFPVLKSGVSEKIGESESDIIHFDLEDSIADGKKQNARAALSKLLVGKYSKPLALRVNSLLSQHGINDLNFIKQNGLFLDVAILPKVESFRDIEIVGEYLSSINPDIKIFAVIETTRGLNALNEICQSGEYLAGLIFGAADMSSEMGLGVDCTSKALDFVRYEISKAAISHQLLAIDSPCFDLNDLSVLESECLSAKDLGFSGKIALHPAQVATINSIFSPSEKDIAVAKTIVNELKSDSKNISKISNSMIGPPFLRMAENVIRKSRKTP